jgi:hypothetical protein
MNFGFKVSLEGDFREWSAAEHRKAERAVTRGIGSTIAEIKTKWRGEVATTLGQRLSKAVRGQVYPQGEPSARAAGMVWTKAAKIIAAHESGATIRSANGFWLAIPLPAAGRGNRGGRITPGDWEKRRGRRLRFVYRRGRTAMLVDDGTVLARAGKRGRDGIWRAARGSRARQKDPVAIFALVPQVRLKKRLQLIKTAEAVAASTPARIISAWEP